LPDKDLAYFSEGTEHFDDYVEAVEWAQDFARWNRHLMMEQIVGAVRESGEVRPFVAELKAINCHHNYVARERHYGQNILVTRKGAVRAREGDMDTVAHWLHSLQICRNNGLRNRSISVAKTALQRVAVTPRTISEWLTIRDFLQEASASFSGFVWSR